MRILGYLLLVLGFVYLVLFAACAHKRSIVALGHHLGELPKQETFARKEVERVIWKASFYGEQPFARTAVPALLMLCGGILLDTARRRQKGGKDVA